MRPETRLLTSLTILAVQIVQKNIHSHLDVIEVADSSSVELGIRKQKADGQRVGVHALPSDSDNSATVYKQLPRYITDQVESIDLRQPYPYMSI